MLHLSVLLISDISDGVKSLKVLTGFGVGGGGGWRGGFEKGKVDKFTLDLCVKKLRDILMEKGYLLKIVIWSLCVLKVAGLQTVFSGLTRKGSVEAFWQGFGMPCSLTGHVYFG